MNAPTYKSPPHKLVAFFQRSRNQWRARAKEYQSEKRSLQDRLRDLEESRDHWRDRYFQERPVATPAYRGHEPPPAGAIARRSLTPTLNV
jgi:hypothetical protein